MPKVTLTDITSGFSSTDDLNDNFTAIETAFDNTLSRDGSTPNSMSSSLDMNSNQIINLPAPATNNAAARLQDVLDASDSLVSTSAAATTLADSGGLYASSNVEGALAEVVTLANTQTITGDKTLSGTVTVSGNASFTGNVDLGNAAVDVITAAGTVNFQNDITLGSSSADTLTVNASVNFVSPITGTTNFDGPVDCDSTVDLSGAVLLGATPLVFEGATADAFETSLAITDPTADRTVTVPDATGDLMLTLNRSVTAVDVVNSTTETSLYSFSVPANTLKTNRTLRLFLQGDGINNSGATRTATFRVKFGGTTVATLAPSWTVSASRRGGELLAYITGTGATNTQHSTAKYTTGTAVAAGASAAETSDGPALCYHNALAIDTTAAQTVEVTVEFGTLHASLGFKKYAAFLELV